MVLLRGGTTREVGDGTIAALDPCGDNGKQRSRLGARGGVYAGGACELTQTGQARGIGLRIAGSDYLLNGGFRSSAFPDQEREAEEQ